jgi:hypothetical protein
VVTQLIGHAADLASLHQTILIKISIKNASPC